MMVRPIVRVSSRKPNNKAVSLMRLIACGIPLEPTNICFMACAVKRGGTDPATANLLSI
jgi:hypothetical protein